VKGFHIEKETHAGRDRGASGHFGRGGHAGRKVSGKLVPEYEALADAVGYALDLVDFTYAAEAHIFAAMEHLDDY
jgi:hypothetical protein